MKQYHGRKRTGRKKSIRLLSVMLCFCLLITACSYMPGAALVHAAGGQENGRDAVIQALLDRIAALPDSEAYLAKEPDTEEEEAYAEWMEGLHQYAGEALDIQEAYEELTKEQQALVSEEALAKLTAWAEIAEGMVLSSAEVLADHSHPVCGASCSHSGTHGSLSWQPFTSTGGELEAGNYYLTENVNLQTKLTIPSGTEVNLCLNGYTLCGLEDNDAITLNGVLTVCDCSNGRTGVLNCGGKRYANEAVIMEGGVLNLYGGKLTGNSPYDIISVRGGSTVNLFGGMVEGGTMRSINNSNGTVIISGNAVVSSSGCAVVNNGDNTVLTVKDNAILSSEGHGVRSWGTVNIEGGTITSTKTDGYGIDNQEGVLNIKSGTITGNKYGVWMDSDAFMKLSGSPAISGTTADLYLQTASGATLDNVKVDATGYTGNTLSVEECSTSGSEGAYAIKVSEGSKDKFTLKNEDWVYAYKNGGLMIHSHDYTYTAGDEVITESCAKNCGHSATATLTLRDGANLTYTGSEIKPVTVKYSDNWVGTGAEKPDDTEIAYTNNKNAGTATAKLTIASQTASLNFTIASKPLTADMVTIASGPHSYTGSEIEPAITVKDGGNTLTSGTDYTVSYSDNTSVGNSAKVAITGKGNYTGTINKTFAITAADISGATVTLSSTTLTYNGSEQTKGVSSVKIGNTTLTEGTDYTVSGNTGTDAGTYTITITGKGNYAGSPKEVTYKIEPKSLTGSTVTVASGPHYYNGSGITPAVTVKDGGKTLEKGKDYTVSYSDNINPGTATVAVTGTGNYKDTINGTFTIGYSPLPSERLTDYITISPEPTNGWYGSDITLTPKSGCEVGETSAGIGAGAVTISQETGTDGSTKTIYIKDGGNIYQTEFSYKLDKTPPAVDLTNMTVENGTKNLWDWIIGKKSMMIKIPASGITETLSGVAEVSYTAESGDGTAQTKTIHVQDGYYEIALNAEFSGTIKLAVKDKAGNTTQASLTADSGKVIAEDYAPVVTFTLPDTLTPNADGWYNATVTITVAVTDNKDSNSGTILSGGISAIRWKDGESGTVQTVADLPGNAPAYEKEFTISVNTDGTHTYYVNVVDNARNESGWQTVTVKVDTGNPVFSGNLTVTNPTEEGADIVFTPSEGGKVYWIVSDTGTAPSAQEVKEQSGQKGGVQDIAGGTENSFTITGLSAGEEHTVYVVLEDAAGNLSEVKTESFLTLQKAPEITLEQLALDYKKETITLPDNFRDVEVYTDPQDPEHSKITPNADGLPVTPGSAVYIRYPQKTESGITVPASDKVRIQIPGRPDKPAAKQVTVTDTTASVKNPAAGEEYALVKKGQTPDWSNANTTGQFTGLSEKTEYDLYVRKKATENSFVSEPAKKEIRTSVAIKKLVITGDGAGKDGNTAPKPDASNADGTVTFTGTYSEEYTPVIRADSQEYTPEMTWDKDSGKGGWEYTYPIPDDAAEVEITVEFRKRTLTGITAEPGSLMVYADDAANVGMETLNDYVKENSSTQAAYDNKTSGTVQAAYTTTDSFEPKGGVYGYTVSVGGKTANATLTVNTVSAAATAPDKCLRNQKAGGYTEAEVAAWLPGQTTVTYTGAGYTTRTESRAVTWDTASIGTDFGAETGEKTITGTVDLPAWATGQNTVSIVIEFVDKIVIQEEKPDIRIDYRKETLKGFTPGEKYKITVKGNMVTITAATDGTLKLEEEWLGTTVSIVKCGNGKDKLDSDALSLTIPARSAQAPSPSAVGESRPGAADGKLTGLEADKNYQISTDNGATWTDTAADKNGEITKLAPGSYLVRVSGTDSAFAGSPGVKVTIAAGQETRPETEHKFPGQWTVEKEATEKEPGREYKICETCGTKIYRTIDPSGIPADPYAGKIEKEVEVLPGAPDTVLNNSREELAQSILTPEEIAEVENGTDAKIWLEVAPDVDIAEEEKAQVQKAAEESVGAGAEVTYFDASLFKQVGNGAKTIIHEPGRPVSVTIVIPEDIRNKDVLMVRNYHIIRLHDGKTDLIEGTYKEESAEFTFETDKFSVYAICYKDSPKQATPETPTPTPGETAEPGTPTPAPGGTTEPGTPTPTPEMPSKEEQTKNELTLNAKVKVSQSGRKIKVSWGKLSDADGYDVYVQYCGKKFTKKSITAVKSGKTTKVTVKKVNGKPLNLKKNYKIYVLAYKRADGKKITLGKTITAHIVGRKNTKYTNVKAVKVKKSSYRLKKGKTAQIKAKTVMVSPGKKQLTNAHAKQFRYAATNKKVATVSKKGKIKAVGKGTCTIYVYARNGYAKKIKVTVK